MKVSSAVEKIIEERGKEILKSSDIVQAMVMDYVTGYENEKKLFGISCKNGILNYAYEILQLSDMEQQRVLAVKAKSRLKQEAFLSEENATYAINIILEALCVGFQLIGDEIRIEKIESEKRSTGELSREEYLWHIVETNNNYSSASKEECEEIFMYGKALMESDKEKALKCIRFAAQYRVYAAMNYLGDCHKEGINMDKNPSFALTWYQMAAMDGDCEGMSNLGECYRYGIGVRVDEEKSFYWYKKAAKAGNSNAQYMVGDLYENGIGKKQNSIKAYKWYKKAAKIGHEEAKRKMSEKPWYIIL